LDKPPLNLDIKLCLGFFPFSLLPGLFDFRFGQPLNLFFFSPVLLEHELESVGKHGLQREVTVVVVSGCSHCFFLKFFICWSTVVADFHFVVDPWYKIHMPARLFVPIIIIAGARSDGRHIFVCIDRIHLAEVREKPY
jgi:hypothetical protein